MNHSNPIRFGVLGTGRITRRLIADLQSVDGVRVTAVASRSSQRAAWHADNHGIAAGVTGYAELLARDDVDAVYIALPPALHHEWMIAAADAGKHVLCEKPLATTAAEAVQMAAACDQAGVAWLDATAWMHHDRTAAFADWIARREDPLELDPMPRAPDPTANPGQPPAADRFRLGPLRHVSAAVSFLNPFQSGEHRLDPSLGGGCLLDLGWYAAGAARFATGRLPATVMADVVAIGGVPHRVTAMMRFDDDVSATISCGFDTATRKWMEIAGGEASIVCDDFTRPWADKPARCWIHEASGKVHSFSFTGNQENAMIARLVDAVRSGDHASLAGLQTQAIQTQQILDALTLSAQHEQSVALETVA